MYCKSLWIKASDKCKYEYYIITLLYCITYYIIEIDTIFNIQNIEFNIVFFLSYC